MQIQGHYRKEAEKMEIPEVYHEGSLAWQSPSNIALIKYWGKKHGQHPMNPSLSFSLQDAHTRTRLKYRYKPDRKATILRYFFEGRENEAFARRISLYLEGIREYLPFLPGLSLEIYSENTFPHSSGIASSASAFSALALCLVDMESELSKRQPTPDDFYRKASFLARLGSGSACRSVYGGLALWGTAEGFPDSSDEYAIPFKEGVGDEWLSFQDSILLLEMGTKSVSSSMGHALMDTNPFATTRFSMAQTNLEKLHQSMQEVDLMHFLDIVEYEALTLHAMMMTSFPGYLLLKPASLEVIKKIREYRHSSGIPVGFTIDAGANIHVLYPEGVRDSVRQFMEADLRPFCVEGKIIHDRVGEGPLKLTTE